MAEELTVAEYVARYRRKPTLPKPPDPDYSAFVRLIGDLCTKHDLDLPTREYHFARPKRDWRFDFCWPRYRLALEYEGGNWTAGRHVRGQGYSEDCVKYSVAALLGWTVLRVTIDLVHDGTAASLLAQALRLGASRAALEGERWTPPTLDLPSPAPAPRSATTGRRSARPRKT